MEDRPLSSPPPPDRADPPAPSGRPLRRGLRLAGLALAGLVLLLGAAWAALQVPAVRQALVRAAVRAAAGSDAVRPLRVELEGLGPGLPFSLRLDRLALADAAGPWLTVQGLALGWSPWPLLTGRLQVDSLAARRVALTRLPASPDTPPAPSPTATAPAPAAPGHRRLLPGLRIRELALDQVFLAAAVVDRDLTLAVRSSLHPAGDDLVFTAAASALDGRPDRLAVNATLARDLSTLTLDLRADEAPGGFLGWTLGLSDTIPLSLSLSGAGELARWKGSFRFAAPGALAVNATLRLAEDQGLVLHGAGRVELAPDLAPARLEDIWRGGVDVDFAARPDADGLIRVERLDLAGPQVRASLAGWAHLLDLTLDARGQLVLKDPAALLAGSGLAVAGLAPLDVHATGEIEFMNLDVQGRADSLRLHGLDWAEPRLDLTVRTLHSLYHRDPGLAANATLTGPRLDLDRRPLAREPALDAAFSTADFRDLAFPGVRLRARGLDLGLDGHLDAATLAARANLDIVHWDGRDFPAGIREAGGPPLSGSAQAQVRADLNRLAGQATLSGRLLGLAGLHPALAALAGPDTPLTAELAFDRTRLAVARLAAEGKDARLTGSGDWNFAARNFRATAGLDAPAASLGRTRGLDLAGRLRVEGTAEGTPADFAARAEARVDGLALAGLDLGAARAGAVLAGLPAAPRGGLSLSASPAAGPLDLSAGLASAPDRLRLQDIAGRGPGLDLAGNLDLDPATGLVTGRLHGEMHRPDLLRGRPDRPVRGAARLDLALDGQNATQAADLRLALHGLAVPDLRLDSLDGAASLADLRGRVRGEVHLAGRGLSLSGLELADFAAEVAGDRDAARFTVRGAGQAGRPLDLAARGTLAARDTLRVGLERLAGTWDGRPIALAAPADLEFGADLLSLHGLDLDLAGGHITASGTVSPAGADLAATARDLPLRLAAFFLPLPLDGRADATLRLAGSDRDPDLDLDLTLRRVARSGRESLGPVCVLRAAARLRAGRLRLDAGLTGLGKAPLALAASLPLRCTLLPWSLALPAGEALSGSLRGELDPGALARLADLQDHFLSGRAVLDLALSGTPGEPALDGSAQLAEGRYESAFLGLLLTDLSARLEAAGRRIDLRELAGSGPGKGRVAASGHLDLDPEGGFPFALDVHLDKLAALRRDDLSLSATGRALLAGNATAARVSGTLALDPVTVRIPDRLPADIPDLAVTEVNVDPVRQQARAAAEAPAPPLALDLDLNLTFPGRCFVRGRGLDAEFSGRVRVGGRPDTPTVNGTLSVVRGRYEFLGKSFSITSGSLLFDGSGATPFLNVRAQATTGDVTAEVQLVGPPRSFTLNLESDPALPRDEILARLLFGRSTANLNPFQAAQLANAVRVLTLGGPSLDPTTTFRQALGLDQLGVSGAEGDKGAGLTMGKYLRENVYIEVRQDLTKGGEEVSLEVEVAPNLGVESTTGTERSGVGLNWKKDY